MKFIKIINTSTNLLIEKLPIEKWYFWVSICLIFNIAFFYYNLENIGVPKGQYYTIGGDALQYVNSAENVATGKDYTFHKTNSDDFIFKSNLSGDFDKGVYYTFRTPGFAFVYVPLRWIFSKNATLLIILVLQLLFSALAKYFLSKIAFDLTQRKSVFLLLIISLNLTGYTVLYNNMFFTESLALSFFIISIYCLFKYFQKGNKYLLILSGLLLTETIFLRPFIAPFYLFFIILIYTNTKPILKKYISLVAIFSIPLICVESLWIVRNFIKTEKFIVLSETKSEFKNYNKSVYEQFELCYCTGNTFEWWVQDSPLKWFKDSSDKRNPKELLPSYLFNNLGNSDSLLKAKKYYLYSKDTNIAINTRIYYETASSGLIKSVREEYRQGSPFMYYIGSRGKLLFDFINQPITKPLINLRFPLNIISVFIEAFICYFTFFWGSIALIWGLFHYRKKLNVLLLISIPLFLFLLFPIITQTREYRELFMGFPFMLLIGVIGLTEIKLSPVIKKAFWAVLFIVFFVLAIVFTLNNIRW